MWTSTLFSVAAIKKERKRRKKEREIIPNPAIVSLPPRTPLYPIFNHEDTLVLLCYRVCVDETIFPRGVRAHQPLCGGRTEKGCSKSRGRWDIPGET